LGIEKLHVSTYAICSVPYINFVQGKEVDSSLADQEILWIFETGNLIVQLARICQPVPVAARSKA
jgi:hypothetical protein